MTTPDGLVPKSGVGADLLIHFRTQPGSPLYLHSRQNWHPVTDATKDRSPEGKLVVNVRFGDGTPDTVINADEAVTIATPA